MRHPKDTIDTVECCHPDCRSFPVPDAPVPMCGHHLRKAHEYVSDILLLIGEADEDKILELADAFDAVPFLKRMPTEAEHVASKRDEAHAQRMDAWIQEQKRLRHATEHDPIVYYILFGDRVKIGTTTNLTVRLTAIPHDAVLATEPGGQAWEHRRHREFADLRITGEWFHYREPLILHIGLLKDAEQGVLRLAPPDWG